MNKKVLKLSIIDNKLALFATFCFLVSTIISFYLSIIISTYFYLLAVPLLLITLYLIKLTTAQVKNEYKRLIKKEKHFNDGRHLEYFEDKKRQAKFELHIINGERHGSYKSYFINGQIETDCNYEIGKLHGEYKEYHANGALKLQTQYKQGNQYGETKSFYNNGNKYREFNLINDEYEGEIKEYFKNGNLKFIKNEAKCTFFDDKKNIKCDVELEEVRKDHGSYILYKGLWKNYRLDGTLEYELDFEDGASTFSDWWVGCGFAFSSDKHSDKKRYKGEVPKTILTKGGELFSKKLISYNAIKMAEVNFLSSYAGNRMEESVYRWDTGMRGPPGLASCSVNLKPISSIEDIIQFL